MLFQALDDKKSCVAIYKNNTLLKNYIQDDMTHTWATSEYLCDMPIEYAYLYCQQTLNEICPEHLREEFSETISLLNAFAISTSESKIDINQHCFYDLMPESFLIRFCDVKNKISQYVFDTFKKPNNYEFLCDLHKIEKTISLRRLNLDFSRVPTEQMNFANKNKLTSAKSAAPYIRYNIFGSKTGRLTTKKNSFPILNLNKQFRNAVLPSNEKFVELDYNAFEIRVLLYLLGKDQPLDDIHEWNVTNVYNDTITRDEAKTRIFAWLYNLDSKDAMSEGMYNRHKILNKYWDGRSVTNPFGRRIECDKFHAVSYLVQSTAADIVLRQMAKVHSMLRNKKSHIAFTVHDSVVIDMADEDMSLLPEIKKQFSTLKNTQFLTNVSIGSDFGNMESEK